MPTSDGRFFEVTLVFCELLDRLYMYITSGSHPPPPQKNQPSKKFLFFEIFRTNGFLEN